MTHNWMGSYSQLRFYYNLNCFGRLQRQVIASICVARMPSHLSIYGKENSTFPLNVSAKFKAAYYRYRQQGYVLSQKLCTKPSDIENNY